MVMARQVAIAIDEGDMEEHQAVKAWAELAPRQVIPKRLIALKEHRKLSSKSAVYRLDGVGPAGSAIIVKRCRRWSAFQE